MSKPKQLQDLAFALRQCKSSINDATISSLRELIGEFTKIASTVSQQPNNLVYIDCLLSLTELLNRNEVPCDLREQATVLLAAFIQDEDSKRLLEEELNLTSSLLSTLNKKLSDNLLIQVLKLLQDVTYGSKLSWIQTEDRYGLSFVHVILDKLFEYSSGPVFEYSLGIVVNLCRSLAVQSYIMKIEQFSRLKTILLQSLNTDNLRIILSSMTLIFHLSTTDEKVFSTRNIHQTLEVIFNTLVNKTSGWTPFYAADLLMDLAKTSRTKALLENYQYLPQCLNNILTSLCQKDRRVQHKYMQLLLTFCEVSRQLRRSVSDLVFSNDFVQTNDRFEQLLDQPEHARKESPLFALSYSVMNENSMESEFAARLLKELYEDLVASGQTLNPRLVLLDRMLAATPTSCPNASSREVQRLLRKWTQLLQLMTILCDHDDWYAIVTQKVHFDKIDQLLKNQLSTNLISTALKLPTDMSRNYSSGMSLDTPPLHAESSHDGACVVLRALHFMYTILERHPNDNPFEANLSSFLQDIRLTPLIAYGLVCGQIDYVQIGFSLTSAALLLEEFSMSTLGDHVNNFMLEINRAQAKKASPLSTSPSSLFVAQRTNSKQVRACDDENRPPLGNLGDGARVPLDDAVEQLVNNFQKGVSVKDPKSSDLLAVYEHKLQSLQTKETHLEDLLNTKTMALAQADALIVKYRSRLASSEMENQKLRTLLIDFERQNERNHDTIRHSEQIVQELKRDKAQLSSELKKTSGKLMETTDALKKSQEQSKKLQENLSETSAALKKSLDKVKRLQEECTSKAKAIEELDKNIDSYRSQLDEAEATIKSTKQQVNKYSEITKLINSLTVDPSSNEAVSNALQSSNSSNG